MTSKRKIDDISVNMPPKVKKSHFSDLVLSTIIMNMTDNYELEGQYLAEVLIRYRSIIGLPAKLGRFLLNVKKQGFPIPVDIQNPVKHGYSLPNSFVKKVVDIASKCKPMLVFADSEEQVLIRSPYVVLSRGADPNYCKKERKELLNLFKEYQVFEAVFNQVKTYMDNKNDVHVREEFNKIYNKTNFLPNQCFVNFYDKGQKLGVGTHRDRAPFVTVVISITNDESESLFVRVNEEEFSFKLKKGDAVIFDRTWHGVHYFTRKLNRCTINLFY